jgi:hypothetical protein
MPGTFHDLRGTGAPKACEYDDTLDYDVSCYENHDPRDLLPDEEMAEFVAEQSRAEREKAPHSGNGHARAEWAKTPLEVALAYAALGWRVLPVHWMRNGACSCGDPACRTPGKHPLIAHGHLDASNDRAVVRCWWKYWPSANIGLNCVDSGVVVVDVDPRNGGAQGRAPERVTTTDQSAPQSKVRNRKMNNSAIPHTRKPSLTRAGLPWIDEWSAGR